MKKSRSEVKRALQGLFDKWKATGARTTSVYMNVHSSQATLFPNQRVEFVLRRCGGLEEEASFVAFLEEHGIPSRRDTTVFPQGNDVHRVVLLEDLA